MAGFLNQLLHNLGSVSLRDYQHAAKTFVDGLYKLSPKTQGLFHVYIDLNPTVARADPQNPLSTYELGLMAKTAQLPKFTISNKVYNAYNRKNIVQDKISYDPISITFHDDSSNVVRNFWAGYYGYYYRDSDHSPELYNKEYKYNARQEKNWGFSPDYDGPGAPNYINSIRIYSLSQKQFSSYVLFRPTITSFAHGTHTQGNYDPLEHSMTVAYEAIQYEYGAVSNGTVIGFDHMHYDNTTSPLGGSVGGIQNLNAILSSTDNLVKSLQRGSVAGAISGALNAVGAIQGTGPTNLPGILPLPGLNLQQISASVLRGQNTQNSVFIPTASSVLAGLSKATPQLPTASTGGAVNINSQNSLLSSASSKLANLF
jgi:hypothetical protein